MKLMLVTMLASVVALTPVLTKDDDPAKRLEAATAALAEILDAPDQSLPIGLLEKATCVVIIPDLKTLAFAVGAKYDSGYLSCRRVGLTGWSAPGTVRIEGGNLGFQIGGSSTDLVMLMMNRRRLDKLLDSRFTIGADGSVAAGPVGRTVTAQTDAQMHADILSWSRSQGLLAGVAIEGAILGQDLDGNDRLYGKKLSNRDVVTRNVPPPRSATALVALLNRYSLVERTQ